MPEIYQPRKLPRNRDYPGYQFWCTIEKRDSNAEACFCYAVLCMIDWLKGRLRETDLSCPEIDNLPERARSAEIRISDLLSFTISSGFSAYIVSLPDHGVWAMRLKEPDSDANNRKAVPGRFFATNVGLRIVNDRRVEFGIRIDVTDPEGIPEVEYAFRPAFVRYLFETEDITMRQVCPLPYETAIQVETEEQMRGLRALLDNSEGMLPLIIVTQAVQLPKEEPAPAFGKIPFPPVPSSPLSVSSPFPAAPLSTSFPTVSPLAAPPAGLFSKPFPHCCTDVIDHVIDKFGKDVCLSRITPYTFDATVTVAVSGTFLAWVFQFAGQITILSPEPVREMYADMLRTAMDGMDNTAICKFKESRNLQWKL